MQKVIYFHRSIKYPLSHASHIFGHMFIIIIIITEKSMTAAASYIHIHRKSLKSLMQINTNTIMEEKLPLLLMMKVASDLAVFGGSIHPRASHMSFKWKEKFSATKSFHSRHKINQIASNCSFMCSEATWRAVPASDLQVNLPLIF